MNTILIKSQVIGQFTLVKYVYVIFSCFYFYTSFVKHSAVKRIINHQVGIFVQSGSNPESRIQRSVQSDGSVKQNRCQILCIEPDTDIQIANIFLFNFQHKIIGWSGIFEAIVHPRKKIGTVKLRNCIL